MDKYEKVQGVLIIPEDVTSIEDSGYYMEDDLIKVVFHPHIKKIGSLAFAHCVNLESVEGLAEDVILEPMCFFKCNKLDNMKLRSDTSWSIFAKKILEMASKTFNNPDIVNFGYDINLKGFVTSDENYSSYDEEIDEQDIFKKLEANTLYNENDKNRWEDFIVNLGEEFGVDDPEDFKDLICIGLGTTHVDEIVEGLLMHLQFEESEHGKNFDESFSNIEAKLKDEIQAEKIQTSEGKTGIQSANCRTQVVIDNIWGIIPSEYTDAHNEPLPTDDANKYLRKIEGGQELIESIQSTFFDYGLQVYEEWTWNNHDKDHEIMYDAIFFFSDYTSPPVSFTGLREKIDRIAVILLYRAIFNSLLGIEGIQEILGEDTYKFIMNYTKPVDTIEELIESQPVDIIYHATEILNMIKTSSTDDEETHEDYVYLGYDEWDLEDIKSTARKLEKLINWEL